MISTTELQAVATLAARRAGEHVLANLDRRADVNSANRTDVKHKLDVEAQHAAMEVIRSAFPRHAILGEESCKEPLPESDYLWVVDPIDGTINFFHGLPWWNNSVAVRYRGQAVAAAVFSPELRRLYEATADGPAFCNGVPIHVSETDDLNLAVFQTGANGFNKGLPTFKFTSKLAEMSQRIRVYGAAALDMCMVASGAAEGYFEPGIYHWDMAAASLIVERAGGKCSILREYGGYRMSFLATNAKLHEVYREALLGLLADAPAAGESFTR